MHSRSKLDQHECEVETTSGTAVGLWQSMVFRGSSGEGASRGAGTPVRGDVRSVGRLAGTATPGGRVNAVLTLLTTMADRASAF